MAVLRFRASGTRFGGIACDHPLVGDLTVTYQALNQSGDPDQMLFVYTIEPGSADGTALRLPANWHDGDQHTLTVRHPDLI